MTERPWTYIDRARFRRDIRRRLIAWTLEALESRTISRRRARWILNE